MSFPFIFYALKYNLTDIKAHGKASGNIIKKMGHIFPGLPIKKEGGASDKGKNYLQPPVNIKISRFHFQLSHIYLVILPFYKK